MASWHSDFVLDDWRVSPKLNRVSNDGESITIKHKSMAVLVQLADAGREVLTRDEIMDSVWPGMEVTDDVLTQSIVELRKAFDDDAKHPRIIETIPRVGFRLIAEVTTIDEATSTSSGQSVVQQPSRHYLLPTITLVAAAIVIWVVAEWRSEERNPVITVQDTPSIAVLLFDSLSDDPGNEYFSEGMSDEIRNLLGRIPGLKVIGRASSHAFKSGDEDIREIGRKLGVSTVLEGTVRVSGNLVRINPQLVDTSDGALIWSDSYEREITDVFAVQDEVAAIVIEKLQIHVGMAPTRGRPTDIPAAYALFLRSRILLNEQKGQDASPLLVQAIELDPEFAEAYELLAASYWQQGGSELTMETALALTGDAAQKALAISADLPFAQALYLYAEHQSVSDQTDVGAFEDALIKQPGNSWIMRPLIYELGYAGYHREALEQSERFVSMDPLSSTANYSLGETLYAVGRPFDAVAPLEIAAEMDNRFAKWFIPAADLIRGNDETIISYYESELKADGIDDQSWVVSLIAGGRDPDSGHVYLDRRIPEIIASMPEENIYQWQSHLNYLYLLFGHLNRYYELVFDAGPDKQSWSDANVMLWLASIFRHQGATAHPKYVEAAHLLGIDDTWEKRGPPDYCDKVNDRWICE